MKATTALIICGLLAAVKAGSIPTFPNDWSSILVQAIQINQGGVTTPTGVCCPTMSPECKVQTAYASGYQYFDFTNNRTAFKNPDGTGVVSLYSDNKEYAVDAQGNCQSYCPLNEPLYPMGFGENATNHGVVVYNGEKVTDIYWSEVFPILNITMEYSDFYVVVNGDGSCTPVAEIDHITPFGEQLGLQNTTYVNFAAGPQDASHFVVNGAASCPMDNNCGGGSDDDYYDDGPTFLGRALSYRSYSRRSALYRKTVLGLDNMIYNPRQLVADAIAKRN